MIDMKFTFKVDVNLQEALYAATCYAQTGRAALERLPNYMDEACELTLFGSQVAAIISGLQKAIEAQQSEFGDWAKAQSLEKVRNYIIAETKKQS